MSSDNAIVFLVDDDPRVREALCSLISSVGFRVAAFGSAAEFLQFEKPDAPCCLILDLQLPDVNGLELQRELAGGDAPPIVFVTGHADVPSSVRAMKAGAIEFLQKPFGEQELLQAIDAALALDRASRQEEIGIGRDCATIILCSRLANAKCFRSWSRDLQIRRRPPSWAPARSPSESIGARSCARWARDRWRSW